MDEAPTEIEEWSPVPGFDGYEVSNLGRARSLRTCRGKVGCILKARIPKSGRYASITLHRNGKPKKALLHVLVAEAFVGPRPVGKVCNHKDTDRNNNCSANLEWITQQKNVEHARAHGLKGGCSMKGEKHPHAKLTEADVREIRRLKGIETPTELAKRFRVTRGAIGFVLSGKHWPHVQPTGAAYATPREEYRP